MEHAQWRENIKHTYEYSIKKLVLAAIILTTTVMTMEFNGIKTVIITVKVIETAIISVVIMLMAIEIVIHYNRNDYII